jgi:S1-C subfamily serine protease
MSENDDTTASQPPSSEAPAPSEGHGAPQATPPGSWAGFTPVPPPPPHAGWTAAGPYGSGPQADAGRPPHGGWTHAGPDQAWPGAWPGQPTGWGPTYGQHPGLTPPPAPRQQRRRAARAAVATVGVLAIAGAGIAVGHLAWSPTTSHASATAPLGGSSSSGSGSFGSSGLGSGSSGVGGLGFGSGSSGSSGSGSESIAAGGPADAAAIAKSVDPDLVDINTDLSYEGEEAAGTGMVLTPDGEVLTNNHVIDGATSISVTDIGNGKTYAASVVGYDRTIDVAVLKLKNASGLKTVKLANSSSVKTGEAIVGIGNAGGSGGTPSLAGGSVIALDKSITAADEGSGASEQLHGMIETNADIQPGDSGGPLVNTKGEVIGMDTAALTGGAEDTAATSSEGFSIPIDEAITLAKAIEKGDSSSTVHVGPTAFLGVEVETPGSSAGSPYGGEFGYGGGATAPSTTSGALVVEVPTGTPASATGLVAGDTITAIAGRTVSSPSTLTTDVLALKAGQSVSLTYVDSNGQTQRATVTLASGPPQ